MTVQPLAGSEYDYTEDVKRWENYNGKGHRDGSKDWRYQWWENPASIQILDALHEAIHANPGARLRVSNGINVKGLAIVWICIFSADGHYLTGYNISFPCPPFC